MTDKEAKEAIGQLRIDRTAEKDRHEKALAEFNKRIFAIQKACPHEEVSDYYGGPDGGGYSCDVCGLDFGYNKPPPKINIEC